MDAHEKGEGQAADLSASRHKEAGDDLIGHLTL